MRSFDVLRINSRGHPGWFSVQVRNPPGFRRNDRHESRLSVDKFKTSWLGARVG